MKPFCIIVLVFLASIAPGKSRSETISVRSGEHDGFTRIVLDLTQPRGWTLEQDKSSARLVLRGPNASFDLSDAFRKINTGRVRDLHAAKEANTLSIGLNCDCSLEAFRLGSRMLVIDIKGEAADITSITKTPVSVPSTEISAAATSVTSQRTLDHIFPFDTTSPNRRTLLGFGTLSSTEAEPVPPVFATSSPAPKLEDVPENSAQNLEDETRVSAAEQQLAEQLSRAVSQGLVTPRAARLPIQKETRPTKPDLTQKTGLRTEPEEEPNTPTLNMRVETSADRDFLDSLSEPPLTKRGETCLSAAQLDIAAWAGAGSFGQQLGAYRGAWMGEFDRPSSDVTRKLAKLYIHYGFGAEALHVLATAQEDDRDHALLQIMGEIMEYGHARTPGVFANQFDCDTPAALWAILANETLPVTVEINDKALLRAVNGLPPHLRSLLGPMVSDRLRLVQRDHLAGQVLRLVARGTQMPDAHFELAKADLQLSQGDVTSASELLSNVIDSNTNLSPIALIKLIESRLDADLPLENETAELAGAYAQEYRKQPTGDELKRVHILALAATGAYDEAFSELTLFSEHASQDQIARIRNYAMMALAEHGPDQAFLKYALGIEEHALGATDTASANAIANRLITLGFPSQADRYLHAGADGALDKKRRILRARAALAQMKARRAEAELLDLLGPEADTLRARARSLSGDHQAAQRLFATLEQTDQMIEEAWLAGDWETLRKSGDTLWIEVADMADATRADAPSSITETGVLAQNHALLTKSSKARETMAKLLAHYPLENAQPSAE